MRYCYYYVINYCLFFHNLVMVNMKIKFSNNEMQVTNKKVMRKSNSKKIFQRFE